MTFGFWDSFETELHGICTLNVLIVGNKKYYGQKMRIWIRNTAFFLANLRIYDLRTGTPRKDAYLRFAD